MKLDTELKGMASIFKEWQVPLVEKLFEGPIKSSEAHTFLNAQNIHSQRGLSTVSRASVINFLNNLVDLHLLDYNNMTGKGGYHRVYKMTLTREEFAHQVIGKFINKLSEAFPTWNQEIK